jgi:hypothetical protein
VRRIQTQSSNALADARRGHTSPFIEKEFACIGVSVKDLERIVCSNFNILDPAAGHGVNVFVMPCNVQCEPVAPWKLCNATPPFANQANRVPYAASGIEKGQDGAQEIVAQPVDPTPAQPEPQGYHGGIGLLPKGSTQHFLWVLQERKKTEPRRNNPGFLLPHCFFFSFFSFSSSPFYGRVKTEVLAFFLNPPR